MNVYSSMHVIGYSTQPYSKSCGVFFIYMLPKTECMSIIVLLSSSFVLTGKYAQGVGGLIYLLVKVLCGPVAELLLFIEGSGTEGADIVDIVAIDVVADAPKQEIIEESDC